MRKIISIVTVCFIILTALTGCSVLQKLGLQKDNKDEVQPASSIVMSEEDAKKLTDKVPIHLYFATPDSTKLKLEVRYISAAEAKKSTNNLASIVVKELINGPVADPTLKATIPQGTQLRSPVSINGGVATVDLTGEFVKNHPGGKTAEQLTIYSIVNSLTEITDIEKVKFTIDGKVQADFKGSYKLDAPFPKAQQLVSMEVPLPDSVTTSGSKQDSTGKADSTSKPGTTGTQGTSKTTDTKAPSTGTNQSLNTSDEEAEAVYLETIE